MKLSEKYPNKCIWGWASESSYMATEKEQIEQLKAAGCEAIYCPSDGNTIEDAIGHSRDSTRGDIMVVVGLRVLKDKHEAAMAKLSNYRDNLFSLATNTLYNCRDAKVFAAARKEVIAQRMAPMSESENPCGPKLKLTSKLLKIAKTMQGSDQTLVQISAAMLDQHDLTVSPSTLSRRLKEI